MESDVSPPDTSGRTSSSNDVSESRKIDSSKRNENDEGECLFKVSNGNEQGLVMLTTEIELMAEKDYIAELKNQISQQQTVCTCSSKDESKSGGNIIEMNSEVTEPAEEDSMKSSDGRKRAIAYEKMISLRDKEILALRNNAKLLAEKVSLLESSSLARKDNMDSIQRQGVELEFMHQENDRVRMEATIENARLCAEIDTLKAQLVCESDKNITLSEKLADATLVSERTMLAYGTQENLINAKQEIIDSLKKEIQAIKLTHKPDSKEAHTVREVETMTSNADMTPESSDVVPRSKVVELTEHYDAKIKIISDEIAIQAELTRKTENALKAKDELLEAKDEIIDGLKIIVEFNKLKLLPDAERVSTTPATNDMTSKGEIAAAVDLTAAVQDQENTMQTSSIKECCEFIQIHANHGVITNGLLLWADIKRKQHPENIWKEEAVKKFTKQEITDAKEVLWRVSGEEHVGKKINRQGQSKSTSEMNDICTALKKLSEIDAIPMFLCTSGMIAETSLFDNSPLTTPVKENEQLTHIDESIGSILEYISKQKKPVPKDQTEANAQNVVAMELGSTIPVTEMITNENSEDEDNRNNRWKQVPRSRGKRKVRLNEAELVISGVQLGVKGLQIAMELANNDIELKDWELLTKRNDARTLAYKLTVSLADRRKLEDENLWPEGTTIRPFVPQKRENKTGGNAGKKHLWEPGQASNGHKDQHMGRNSGYQDGFPNRTNQGSSKHFSVDVPANRNIISDGYTPLYSQIVQNNAQNNVTPVRWQNIPVSDDQFCQNNLHGTTNGRQTFPGHNLVNLNNIQNMGGHGNGQGPPTAPVRVFQDNTHNIETHGGMQGSSVYHRHGFQDNAQNPGISGNMQVPTLNHQPSMMQSNGQSTGTAIGMLPPLSQKRVRILDRIGTNMYAQQQ